MLGCLIKISAILEGTEDREDFYLTSANDRRVTRLNGVRWEPAITEAPAIGMQFWNGDFEQGTEAGKISFTINLDTAQKGYPHIADAAWSGADVEVMMAPIGQEWPWATRFKGKVSTYSGESWPILQISAEVDVEPFGGNVLIKTYAGTGGAEGGPDLKDQVKPLALGRPLNVEPVLINEVDSVYQFSAYGPIESIPALYERASAFPPAMGNFATYDDLVAATIKPGAWATCLSEGLIRLGAPAYGVITGDIRGHRVGSASPRSVGAQVVALADILGIDLGLISTASLNAIDTEGHANSDIVITEQVTFLEAARRLIMPVNRQVVISNLGVMAAMKPLIAGAPAMLLHAQGRARPLVTSAPEQPTSLPYKTTTMAAERNWRLQTFDEISTSATLVDRGSYDPETVYREGNIVTTDGGSRWVYISQAPFSGVTPGTDPTVWASLEGESTYPDGTPMSELQPDEKGADVTSNIIGSAQLWVECTSAGVPMNGELPKTANYRLFRGNANATAASAWSVSINFGTVGVSIGPSTGILVISSITTETAQVRISAKFGEKFRYLDVDIQKTRAKASNELIAQLEQQAEQTQQIVDQVVIDVQAQGTAIQGILVRVDDNTADIELIQTQLDAIDGPAIAQLTNQVGVLASAQETLAGAVLSAVVKNDEMSAAFSEEKTIRQNSVEVVARSTERLTVQMGDVEASIISESIARVTEDQALSTRIDTQTAQIGANTASITQQSSVLVDVQGNVVTLFARAAVTLDVNGYMTGWEQNNNGQVGSFIIHTDYFAIRKPGGGAKTEAYDGNFYFTNGAGVLKVEIGSNLT